MKGRTCLFVAALMLAPLGACSSDSGTTTPAVTVPGAPTGIVTTIGDGSITLAFIAPTTNGGATISSYTAACSAAGVTRSATGTASPITVTGLANGAEQSCTVSASNSAGAGALSAAVSRTPATVPSAPTVLSATAGNGTASIAFTAPASNGGSAIASYVATCGAAGVSRTGTGPASPIVVSGLTNGIEHSCAVMAINGIGEGLVSAVATVTPATVPAVPTNVAAAAGDTSARITFTAPTSNGGSPITSYVASCTTAGASRTATGPASPLTVNGLTNGAVYSCAVVARNAIGSSAASAAVSVTPVAPVTSSTAGVGCTLIYSALNSSPKINATSSYTWTCSATVRALSGTGIPDHAVVGGNFATQASTQRIAVNFTMAPAFTGTATQAQIIGYALNSVKLDPGTAGTCTSNATSTRPGDGCVAIAGQDPWRIEALGGAFTFGTDENNAHTQPDGAYHYHGMPEGVITRQNKGTAMTLVGWSVDGFPIYARFGYTVATNATSAINVLRGSWQKKAAPDAGRPSATVFPMGTFQQDYEYVAGSGDLDECNGRTGVTPEFPNGIYHYYITDTYPYIQRCIKGTRPAGGGPPPPP